jgi:hypothetical protein
VAVSILASPMSMLNENSAILSPNTAESIMIENFAAEIQTTALAYFGGNSSTIRRCFASKSAFGRHGPEY